MPTVAMSQVSYRNARHALIREWNAQIDFDSPATEAEYERRLADLRAQFQAGRPAATEGA